MKSRKKVICGIAAMIMTLLCAILPAFSEGAEEIMTVEAETGELMGNTGVSGDGAIKWVEGFRTAGADSLSAEMTVTREGFYDIAVIQASLGGHKENQVLLDGANIGTVITEETTFGKSVLEHIFLSAGSHTLGIGTGWGYIRVDRFELTPSAALPEDLYDIPEEMSVGEATPEARRLYDWLREGYGKRILSGQQCDGGMYGMENQAVWRATGGDYPAVLGLDMMEYSLSRVEYGGESDRAVPYAIEYWNKGGIVTFCWHWNAPSPYLKEPWYSGFYTKSTSFNLDKVMNGEDEEGYRLLNRDIDAVAAQLLRLKEAGVPVLWRPLHEASGGWFWWGASGKEAYLKLYHLLFDRLTHEYGLNNLIWIWNGQDPEWYPGDDEVDLIGTDITDAFRIRNRYSVTEPSGDTGAPGAGNSYWETQSSTNLQRNIRKQRYSGRRIRTSASSPGRTCLISGQRKQSDTAARGRTGGKTSEKKDWNHAGPAAGDGGRIRAGCYRPRDKRI